ncbi:MAG: dipeptide epimerase [Chthoniobacteraceae bacterium]
MDLQTETFDLETRHPFRIARSRRAPLRNVFLSLTDDGATGLGEASPAEYYGESAAGVVNRIAVARTWLQSVKLRSKADIHRAWNACWEYVAPSRAAQCAIDLALWDWLAQREGVSVTELALGKKPAAVTTFGTIGLSSIDELPIRISELESFDAIKIKSDQNADLDLIEQIRAGFAGTLAVDANGAWEHADLSELCRRLAALRVTFIEQPFPPGQDSALDELHLVLPVFADESCVTEEDVDTLPPGYAGFNIKLVKCGGLTPALRMARRGRERGRQTLVGCMLESSVLIAAGCVVAQKTDFADLDGAWLLAHDPAHGWMMDRGRLQPPSTAGLGVSRPVPAELAEASA